MTVNQAILAVQGKPVGMLNRFSSGYAESLLVPGETVLAAAEANIRTSREHYPGIVVITDQRILAVCGLPGIRRSIILQRNELEQCAETSTLLQYRASFLTRTATFSMSVSPDVGEAFSAYVAQINGEEFEDIQLDTGNSILNPKLLHSLKRNKLRREREKARTAARDASLQREAAENPVQPDTTEPPPNEAP